MVHDVRDRDDVYAFHSSFLLEVIRGKLSIAGHGARKAGVPQIVREYHARLALALEGSLKTSQNKLHEVANHFHAAGARYAAKGVEYCLAAASASAAGYDFRRAENYLEMAEECAELSAAGPVVEMERQVIRCQEAQVASQGEQRAQAAAAGLAYLKEHPAAPARLVLAVAQLCYDVGHRSREPRWYEDATRLCRQIVAHPASPQEEAEARHIMAVSQPFERRAERIAELRKAYGLLEHATAEDRAASRWFAQIMISLAKELSKGTAEERSEAKRLFECRLQLETQRQLGDPRGAAMAVAGLGRLEWFTEPKNVAAAEKHFERNLEISEAIGDVIAQVKMHSLLGACALEDRRTRPGPDSLSAVLGIGRRSGRPVLRRRWFAPLLPTSESPRSIRGHGATALGLAATHEAAFRLRESIAGGAQSLPRGGQGRGCKKTLGSCAIRIVKE